ncbi:MAG: hypothetical protein SPH68_01315 [Candidatus Borkfalkiaceae bacterium]|nr:hypothetical protein [Clostridia bacterium]MDY6222784.1 hypothetical protein [Christensenellaceae bacterium]
MEMRRGVVFGERPSPKIIVFVRIKFVNVFSIREYRQLFVAHGIDLSYEQVVINQPSKSEIKANKTIKKEAEEFVAEQKIVSEGIEEQQRDQKAALKNG